MIKRYGGSTCSRVPYPSHEVNQNVRFCTPFAVCPAANCNKFGLSLQGRVSSSFLIISRLRVNTSVVFFIKEYNPYARLHMQRQILPIASGGLSH